MRANFALDYDVLSVERPQKLYLMAHLTADSSPKDRQRRPLNISLVIDRSGSMAGEKIEYTRQAAQLLVQNLSIHDTLSIVLYNDQVETLLMPENVQRKDVINQQLRGIKPGGTTNLSAGWLQACGYVAQNLKSDQLNRVILMSDGHANRGVTTAEKLVTLAQQKYSEGVSTTTMGLGKDFNEDLLMTMANAGGGAFYFIESPEVAPLIFQEELQGLLSVIGQNLSISLERTDYVTEVKQLNAYPMETNGRRSTFRLGDVFGDEVKALVVELSIPALKEIGQRQIATLRFEYDELGDQGAQRQMLELPVMVNVAATHSLAPQNVNINVRRSVLILQAAGARRQAVESADKGKYREAAEALRSAAELLAASGLMDEREISEEQSALLKQADEMERGAEAYDQYSRKSMSTQAFYSMVSRHDETVVLRYREQSRKGDTTDADKATQERPKVQSTPETHPPITAVHQALPSALAVKWGEQVFQLHKHVIRMGRAPENDVIVNVKGVSRFHAQLKQDGEAWWIEDMGSTNGTTVNGVPLTQRTRIQIGDEILLCDEKVQIVAASS
ncbi:MAG: VWA domain-containing protein [Anaerolineae bacterium]|jgi:Ca-activated chloride channel family protein|nr:VWA domain-containing protein [Anaerolineae bacterium]